jgi:hypothetical protein
MRATLANAWPTFCATALFIGMVALVGPWSDFPVNDDWQYAHLAKAFAEWGTFHADVPIAPTAVGQSLLAWPVIQIFGFSHVALRVLTIALSILILFELDYLLSIASVRRGVRFVALSTLVVNPLFLHLSLSFMTENYGYCVALLAACVWYWGQRRNSRWTGVAAAGLSGCAFWIRQFSALVFPALLLAEYVASGKRPRNLRHFVAERGIAISVWVIVVLAYFPWARATGNYRSQFAEPLARVLSPAPFIFFVELGVYVFYLTFFFAAFLFGYARRERSVWAWLIPALLVLTAGVAGLYGDHSGSPRANLRSVFPFLHNVFTYYGVGPVTITDFYRNHAPTGPSVSLTPWMALELVAIVLSAAWAAFAWRVRATRNEIGLFGIFFAVISFAAVVLSFQFAIFDRYHYPGLLGFTLALGVFFPVENWRRLRGAAVVWLGALGIFSALSLHDYFRWQEARASLLMRAHQRGIRLTQIDAGYEPNGWNSVEHGDAATGCGLKVTWFCSDRPFRVGLEQAASDTLILSAPVSTWFVRIPDLKLLQRR